MAFKVTISGTTSAINYLKSKRGKLMPTGTKIDVNVIYTAPYALYVHEDLQTPHRIGEAKFLTKAVAKTTGLRNTAFHDNLKRNKTMEQALIISAQMIITESQKLVPVDTGFLKNSVITTVTRS